MKASDISRLAEEHGKSLYNFCLRITADTYNAEELYQDTFLKALEKASSIDENNNPRAYLYSIALSLWKSKQRKAARRHSIAPMVSVDDSTNATDEKTADEAFLKKELHAAVRNAVSELDEKLRLPVLFYYIGELSLAEIAQILKCPEGTVKSRLHTARGMIKEKMEVYENGKGRV